MYHTLNFESGLARSFIDFSGILRVTGTGSFELTIRMNRHNSLTEIRMQADGFSKIQFGRKSV
jgi:hypothetical protein